ncbi:MAG: molybdopterin-dependent oxidoreductase [Alphaproteobacteria bacterium]|nr:molybdopterin-dependent oxidoreductase [Alphaproteobacteria bacterium]
MNMMRIGDAVLRDEDRRFLTGRGLYVDDVHAWRETRAVVLRSPHAHADIRSMDASAALAAPGAVAVLTGDDLAKRGLGSLKPARPGKRSDGAPGFVCSAPLLAQGRVRYVGEPVAFVVAETPEQAQDAAELIAVDYAPLPALAHADDALAPGALRLWDANPDNEAFTFEKGDAAATDAAFAGAAHVVKHRVEVTRVACNAIETRGCIAEYDAREDRYTLRATVQGVHQIRNFIAGQIFRIPQRKLRVICDSMGGGFGIKGGCYPEYSLALWASELTGRPVKWIGDRTEAMLADEQGRGSLIDAELALDGEYRFLGFRYYSRVAIGAYFTTDRNLGAVTSGIGGLIGVYRTPAAHVRITGALTNMMGNAQYRGGSKPEPCYVIEVMVDKAARDLGVDPAELRRINTVQPSEMPYRSALGENCDCGDFPKNLEDCLAKADYAGAAARREEARGRGRLLGIGMSTTCASVAGTNFEHAEIRFDQQGGITLVTGAMDHGQGHGTTFRQVLADKLGIDADLIDYRFGDTDKVSTGLGSFNARSAAFAGSAVAVAAGKVIEKGKRIAAHLLEAAEGDIEFEAGAFTVAGTDRAISLEEVAKASFQKPRLPNDIEPGLYEHGEWGVEHGSGPTFPSGCHYCEVEVDAETGRMALTRYVAVDEAGTVLNPLLFEGQIHGGIVQGASQIMMEEVRYDRGTGQLLTASFMDYCMPRADDFCTFEIGTNVIPTARNPLGVKGVGEAGTVGAMPAVMNAINDALFRAGAPTVEMPATPERLWRALRAAT